MSQPSKFYPVFLFVILILGSFSVYFSYTTLKTHERRLDEIEQYSIQRSDILTQLVSKIESLQKQFLSDLDNRDKLREEYLLKIENGLENKENICADQNVGLKEISNIQKDLEQLVEKQSIFYSQLSEIKGKIIGLSLKPSIEDNNVHKVSGSAHKELPIMNELKTEHEEKFEKLLTEYEEYHDKVMNGSLPPKFVKCILINGIGNVLQEAISCFFYALQTWRALIWETRSLDHFLPLADFLENSRIDAYNRFVLDNRDFKEETISSYDLGCYDNKLIEDREWVSIQGTFDYFGETILFNPRYNMTKFFPENFFQLSFNFLFNLKPELQKRVDEFKNKYFSKYTIGIQIRVPTIDAKTGQKDHKGHPVPELEIFGITAERLSLLQSTIPDEEVVWFLATQSPEVKIKLQSLYPHRKIVEYDGPITTTFDDDFEGKLASMITFWLLGECQEVIGTEISSFGTTAAARSGIVPIVCTHQESCYRKLFSQPGQVATVDQGSTCLYNPRKYLSPERFTSLAYYEVRTSDKYKKGQDW